MIQNLEEENIIMKYRWHSDKHDYTDALDSLGHSSKLKEEKQKKEEEHINKEKHKDVTFDYLQKL